MLHERLLSLRPPAEATQFVNATTGEQELDQVSTCVREFVSQSVSK